MPVATTLPDEKDRLGDLDGMDEAGRNDLVTRGEQAERDANAVRGRSHRVPQRLRDRAHPVRAEADQSGDEREQEPRSILRTPMPIAMAASTRPTCPGYDVER